MRPTAPGRGFLWALRSRGIVRHHPTIDAASIRSVGWCRIPILRDEAHRARPRLSVGLTIPRDRSAPPYRWAFPSLARLMLRIGSTLRRGIKKLALGPMTSITSVRRRMHSLARRACMPAETGSYEPEAPASVFDGTPLAGAAGWYSRRDEHRRGIEFACLDSAEHGPLGS
jgi:hypothetical protein